MGESPFEYPYCANIYSNNYMMFNKKVPFSGNMRLLGDPEKDTPEK
jgi:hypothetical protein